MSKKKGPDITGLQPLAYMGVDPTNPPEIIYSPTNPQDENIKEYQFGSLWINYSKNEIYTLLNYEENSSRWTRIYPIESTAFTFVTDVSVANVIDHKIRILGPGNLITEGHDNIITINTRNDISILGTLTVSLLNQGILRTNSDGLFETYSDSNITNGMLLIGSNTDIPRWDHLISSNGSIVITNGSNSIDLKVNAGTVSLLNAFTTDNGDAVPISGVVKILGDGTNITTSASSNNITIDLNSAISINNMSAASITTTGNISCVNAASNNLITCNNITVTGTSTFSGLSGVVQVDNANELFANNGTDGQLLIGGGTAPTWANLTSSDNTVLITNGVNSIDLVTVVDKDRIIADSGMALPNIANKIKILGTTNISTSASGDELDINLKNDVIIGNSLTVPISQGTVFADSSNQLTSSQGNSEQFLIGKTGDNPVWLTPISSDGTMVVGFGDPGYMNFRATTGGGGGTGTLDTLSGDTGTATPTAGTVNISGGDNINTTGGGSTITVNLDKSIYLPDADVDMTQGVYFLGGDRFFHRLTLQKRKTSSTPPDYNAVNTSYFIGINAGRCVGVNATTTRDGTEPNEVIGIGYEAMNSASGSNSIGIGAKTEVPYDDGSGLLPIYREIKNCTSIGYQAGDTYQDGGGIYIGTMASRIPDQSSILHIGHPTYHTKAYIQSAITSLDPTWVPAMVVYNNDEYDDEYKRLGVPLGSYSLSDGDLYIGNSTMGRYDIGRLSSLDPSLAIAYGSNEINIRENYTVCFSAYQSTDVANVTGDGTHYRLGSSAVMNEHFDYGNHFYVGDGAGTAAHFEAPQTGVYFFTVSIVAIGVTTAPSSGDELSIYCQIYDASHNPKGDSAPIFINQPSNGNNEQGFFVAGTYRMYAGYTMEFGITINIAALGGKVAGIKGVDTHVSGFYIHEL